jgi:LDH2 family malate/lactate/ureidoglycolate dehydrogenase
MAPRGGEAQAHREDQAGIDRHVSAARLRHEVATLLQSWGMAGDHAASSAEILVQADLFGIESHGVNMLAIYEGYKDSGKLTLAPKVATIRETPVSVLIDAGGGLGHHPSLLATDAAIAKARGAGVGLASVRNSNHYGAAGIYARRIAQAGFLGFAFTGVGRPSVVPTGARQAMFGTNPIAFAAPAKRNGPFLLDMATSTAAVGKLLVASRNGTAIPPVWAMNAEGQAVTDADEGLKHRMLMPLGGASKETGGHKGYGLAVMVEILSTTLAGASYAPLRPDSAKHYDVGHFFMAIDPCLFRDEGAFEDDLDAMIDALHAATPARVDTPVLVAGDPELSTERERLESGIPISPSLDTLLRGLFTRAGLPFTLHG